MDYIPNNAARSLVLGKSRTIGLVLGNINSNMLISEASLIEKILTQRGYSLTIVTSQSNVETESKAIDLLLSNKVDGIILNTHFQNNIPRMERLRKSGYPILLRSGFLRDSIALDSVYPDLLLGSYIATKHLLDMGHKRVFYVCLAENAQDAIIRSAKAEGFRKAVVEAGLTFNLELILPVQVEYEDEQMIYGAQFSNNLLEAAQRETAFVIAEDELAIPVMKHLIENGISIPEDIAIASLDNTRFAESAVVALTSVGFDALELSRQAVDTILTLIDGINEERELVNKSIAPKLFIRDSCGNKDKTNYKIQ
jgi:LacI family transcriptional regulator